jgi:type II secretory pathway predicted ATPase ExeA/putative methionine-R-sulfoxide reductase with GAF domain
MANAPAHPLFSALLAEPNSQNVPAQEQAENVRANVTRLAPSFCAHFGLAENPFGVTPDSRYLYNAWTHHKAFQALVGGIECGIGFQALIAVPGMGKTTLLYQLLERFEPTARTAFVFQTQCNSREFMQYLLSELGTSAAGQELVVMHEMLNRLLLREAEARRRVIAVIDEAQNLDNSVLETVRLLSDFETRSDKLIQIVIAGQQQLAEKLAQPELAQVRQRIPIVMRLEPLGPQETKQYIRHRLTIAGHNGDELFMPEALEVIWEYSHGVPRMINTICFRTLVDGYSLKLHAIHADLARHVIAELDLSSTSKSAGPERAVQRSPDLEEQLQAQDLGDALALVAERARAVTSATSAAVGFLKNGSIVCAATSGRGTPALGTPIELTTGLAGQCVRTGKVLSCRDTDTDSRVNSLVCREIGVRSILSIPFCDGGRSVGLIQIFSSEPNKFDELHLLKLKTMLESMIPVRAGKSTTTSQSLPVLPQLEMEKAFVR